MKSTRTTLALMAIAGIGAVTQVQAAMINYSLQGVTFNDGGVANGSFVWDSTASTVASWSIFTTPGAQQTNGVHYSNVAPGNSQINVGSFGIYLLASAGMSQFNISTVQSLNSAATISMYSSREYNSVGSEFGRNTISGQLILTPVPEPTSGLLFALGLGTLALTGLRVSRIGVGTVESETVKQSR
jgi:hypothetical protein